MGGNKIEYEEDVSAPTSHMTQVKIRANAIISNPKGRAVCFDIKSFYLNTPMKEFEYMHIHLDGIPEDIINEYNLPHIADENGWVYI